MRYRSKLFLYLLFGWKYLTRSSSILRIYFFVLFQERLSSKRCDVALWNPFECFIFFYQTVYASLNMTVQYWSMLINIWVKLIKSFSKSRWIPASNKSAFYINMYQNMRLVVLGKKFYSLAVEALPWVTTSK